MKTIEKVSVHGGHSGQFCNHATDTLEDIVKSYIAKGFSWAGITEHAPPINDELRYSDEVEAGLSAQLLLERFGSYMQECRRLQEKYRSQIQLYAALEIETYSGYEGFVPYLVERFEPDYIVGSVHYVNDINFDFSKSSYDRAAGSAGGIDLLYQHYFDLQYEMIERFKPEVVGHFDLIRIFDPDYRDRLVQEQVMVRMRRNLELIKEYDLILDFNLRALHKGAPEPYVCAPILEMVRDYGIKIVPGDDSHGLSTVGNFFDRGVELLQAHGISTDWTRPAALV
ncbi:MAG: histidinol-phosphatase [Desulfofustis sp.]|nr:histidinol-phosphatase [Desulfofustis sp.]